MSMRATEYKTTSRKPSKPPIVCAFVLLTMVGVGSAGCSLFDKTPEKTVSVDPNIPPANTRTGLLAFLQNQLVDPVGVRDAYITEPALQPIGTEPRYFVCVRYNAKDGFGQYTGSRDYIAIYFNAKLTQYVPAPADPCRSAAYQRFPELEALKKTAPK